MTNQKWRDGSRYTAISEWANRTPEIIRRYFVSTTITKLWIITFKQNRWRLSRVRCRFADRTVNCKKSVDKYKDLVQKRKINKNDCWIAHSSENSRFRGKNIYKYRFRQCERSLHWNTTKKLKLNEKWFHSSYEISKKKILPNFTFVFVQID